MACFVHEWLAIASSFLQKEGMKKLGAFFIKKDEEEEEDDIKVGSLFASKGKKGITATATASTPTPTGLCADALFFGLLALLPACWLVLLAAYFEVTFVFLFVCCVFPCLCALVFLFVCFGLPVCVFLFM